MILSWFRNAIPAILQSAGHRPRRSRTEHPVKALTAVLADGVVLADLVAFLDPARLPSSAVMRGSARNALSLSSQHPSSETPSNIDNRQRFVQYKTNTRRVIVAVKKILDDVRAFSGFPHRPIPGAVDMYLRNVATIPPTQDLYPVTCLAQLVIACAVYGPRHNEFRHSIWSFSSESTRKAFALAMASVAQAVALPPPEVLYAAGPPPLNPSSPHGLLSPNLLSPEPHGGGTRPPPSPTFLPSPLPLSPRAAFIPNPVLSPILNFSSPLIPPAYVAGQQSMQSRNGMPGISPQRRQHLSPRRFSRQSPQPGIIFAQDSNVSDPNPPLGSSQPSSFLRSSGPKSPFINSQINSPEAPMSLPAETVHKGSPAPPPLTTVGSRSGAAAPVSTLGESSSASTYSVAAPRDDGLGIRKFSIVTEEEPRSISPPEVLSTNPQTLGTADVSGELPRSSVVARTGDSSELKEPDLVLEQNYRASRTSVHVEQRFGGSSYPIEVETQSKRSSDGYFTPKEESPSVSPGRPFTAHEESKLVTGVSAQRSVSEDSMTLTVIEKRVDATIETVQQGTKVDETVRMSVATSVTEQLSKAAMVDESVDKTTDNSMDSGNVSSRLFHNDSNPRSSSISMRDQSHLLSPSTADIPSPSNQWQVLQQNDVGHDILSPLPMFSPPPVPRPQSLAGVSTQGTSPLGPSPAQTFFQPGIDSPQLSAHSYGPLSNEPSETVGDLRRSNLNPSTLIKPQQSAQQKPSKTLSLPPRPPHHSRPPLPSQPHPPLSSSQSLPSSSLRQTFQSGKARVSFAPTIVSPGGHQRPLGEPLRSRETNEVRTLPSKNNTSIFSLPPSAAGDENTVHVLARDENRGSGSSCDVASSFLAGDGGENSEVPGLVSEFPPGGVEEPSEENTDGRTDEDYEAVDNNEDVGAESHADISGLVSESSITDRTIDENAEGVFGPENDEISERDLEVEEGRHHEDIESSEETDEHPLPSSRGAGPEGNASFLEKSTFQRVEEFVIYNSDENDQGDDKSPEDGRHASNLDESDGIGATSINDLPLNPLSRAGVQFDEDEEYVDNEAIVELDSISQQQNLPKNVDREPAAEDNGTATLDVVQSEMYDPQRKNANNQYLLSTKTDLVPERDIPGVSDYVPSAADFITPPVTVRHSRYVQNVPLPTDVPMTPPSPPAVEKIMQSISSSKLSDAQGDTHDGLEEDDGPVSTMEPSAGLFQKLIAVWQSADEKGVRPESLTSSDIDRRASHLLAPEIPVSSPLRNSTRAPERSDQGRKESDHDGTIHDGEENFRRHRPRAMRLPHGTISSSEMLQTDGGLEKRDEVEEGASVASFSDAFSSDDKDRAWPDTGRANLDGGEWEEAMKGDCRAGLSFSVEETTQSVEPPGKGQKLSDSTTIIDQRAQGPPRRFKSYRGEASGVMTDGHHVKVDRRRLDWLTKELLAARDAISRKELQMTFAETQRLEQEEILLLERQDAESMVGAMKKILIEREEELKKARTRLSMAIQSTGPSQSQDQTVGDDASGVRTSVESRSSSTGGNLERLVTEGHAKLHERFDECADMHSEAAQAISGEMQALWGEVQRAMVERMQEMTERRDEELEVLRRELTSRERLITNLKQSSSDLVDQNRAMQAETSELRLQKEKAGHRFELEMAHVSAQVELVNEFSKKLHDNFRETENLRQQVLQYQEKLSHITSASGVGQRQIKELREAVTRANDECARLRREADLAKKKGMEAVRRAEELEELRYKDVAQTGRYPDRQDSGSFRSHEPVRPAGHNRPGGTGVNARYHVTNRSRALQTGHAFAATRAWLVIKEKISGIMGKDNVSSRRRVQTGRRDIVRVDPSTGSVSSRSQSRTRGTRDDDESLRSRTASRSSGGSGGSGSIGVASVHSGSEAFSRSGSGGVGRHGGMSTESGSGYIRTGDSGSAEVSRIRATDF